MVKLDWETPEDQAFSAELNGSGIVGQAFQTMCQKGCDPVFLESRLMGLRIYAQRPKKHYNATDRRKLNGIVLKLQQCADDARRFVPMMVFSSIRDWAIDPLEVPIRFAKLAQQLEEASKQPSIVGDRNPSIGERVAELVNEVSLQVGRPHYKEMTDLVGAALRKPFFSEDDLKMMVQRNGRKKVTEVLQNQQPGVTDIP